VNTIAHVLPEIVQLAPEDLLHSTGTEYGSTRHATLQACTMRYDLRYRRKILPIYRPNYFGIGSLVHAGLRQAEQGAALGLELDWHAPIDLAYIRAQEREAKMNVLEEWEIELPDQDGIFDLKEVEEAERLLGAYFVTHGEQNAGWDARFQVVGLEVQLETTQFGIDQPMTGAIDTLLYNHDSGRVVIVDTKTAASRVSPDPDKRARARRKFALRPQFLAQCFMLQEKLGLDEPPDFIVNHLSKAKLPIAERLPLNITQEAIDQWAENQEKIASAMRRGEFSPLMNYSECAPSFGSDCAYLEYCHGTEISRSTRFKLESDSEAVPATVAESAFNRDGE
jgi:hypothetical protein